MTTVVCWNVAKLHAPWRELVRMDADVALLQEAGTPPRDVLDQVETGPRQHWDSHVWNSEWYKDRWNRLYDRWPKVVKLSDRVDVEWFEQVSTIRELQDHQIAVSGIGTIAAARIIPRNGDPAFIAVSMYARWMLPHPSTGTKWRVGHADASAHRIISDLSAFIGSIDPATHRILAAGDLNMSYKVKDDPLWKVERDHTVFERMQALDLEFMGPQYPAGRKAHTLPPWEPSDTNNVPTFYTSSQTPATANRQMDFAFASRGFHQSVGVRALNGGDDWGPSDHCRLLIEVSGAPA